MTYDKLISFLIIVAIFSILVLQFNFNDEVKLLLDKSGPYIGINFPNDLGYYGDGIKIAVIDTGVNHLHPDLFGFGPEGKIVGGYNFVDDSKMPIDVNGHGTQVTGIIAADGELKGIASKSSIFAYKVSEDGESVSSELIVVAVEQAIKDDVDIINISLGINRTNPRIDQIVSKAVENGIVVVTAAGNDGPGLGTIGSPGKNSKVITVGASYNNVTASKVATLEVEGKQFLVLPMVGTEQLDQPITEEIVFGKYGRQSDLIEGSFSDMIVLVERGSDVEDEIVYFSSKESNVAEVGGSAVIVYNNIPGIFFGELFHEFVPPDYQPKIPVLSMSKEDGLFLKELVQNKTEATLNVFYNPDFVASFSSRGPASPFYIKPDLVAPGTFINSTLQDGKYNFTSGTSFAAPHVSGAAALLLQKNPDISPEEVKSLLLTTTDFVFDAYDNKFPFEAAGVGRLNVTRAFEANLIIIPQSLIFNLSTEKPAEISNLELSNIHGSLDKVKVEFDGPEVVNFDFQQIGNSLHSTVSISEDVFGEFQGVILIEDKNTEYHVPVLIRKTEGSIIVNEKDGKLDFTISHPDGWSYAKISAINKDSGKTYTTSVTPKKDSSISLADSGEYWILANINVDGNTIDLYDTVYVEKPSSENDLNFLYLIDIPERPLVIVIVIAIIISAVGLKLRN
ncbi:MAG: Peptidase S8/S53 subtilisin kexin sedolisin [Nitrosopumilales archaeon]|nr:MAG: Peptidase S8/S53 subtilisin kexin sedolisin [Nitrosopumilales archaeon]